MGVTLSGNEAGLTVEDLGKLSPEQRADLHERVGTKLKAAGADYVIETVADLPGLLTSLGL